MILQASCGDVQVDDVWNFFSKQQLEEKGYSFESQLKLFAIYFSRLSKASDKQELTSVITKLYEGMQKTTAEVHDKVKKSLECVYAVSCPANADPKLLEESVAHAQKEISDDLMQVLVSLSTGRTLRSEAKDVLSRRKDAASLSEKLTEISIRAASTIADEKVKPYDTVLIFAQHMSAAHLIVSLAGDHNASKN